MTDTIELLEQVRESAIDADLNAEAISLFAGLAFWNFCHQIDSSKSPRAQEHRKNHLSNFFLEIMENPHHQARLAGGRARRDRSV